MSRTHLLLKAASDAGEWTPEVETIVLAGFIGRNLPVGEEKFVTLTNDYLVQTGLPPDMMVGILCQTIDAVLPDIDSRDAVNPFADYLGGVVAEMQASATPAPVTPEPSAPPAPPKLEYHILVPTEMTCDIDNYLAEPRPLTTCEVGEAVLIWTAKIDDTHTATLRVTNAEPAPSLSLGVSVAGRVKFRYPPIRLPQWLELPKADGFFRYVKIETPEFDVRINFKG